MKKNVLISSICGIVGVLLLAICIINFNSGKKEELSFGDTATSCQNWEEGTWSTTYSCGDTSGINGEHGEGKPGSDLDSSVTTFYQYQYGGTDQCRGACAGSTTCYKTKKWTRQCSHNCPAGYFFDNNSDKCQECGIANYGAGYYCPGGDSYPIHCEWPYSESSGVGHNDTSINSCYMYVEAGYGVESSGADKTQCADGYYYAIGRKVYKGNISACIKCGSGRSNASHTGCEEAHYDASSITVTPTSATIKVGETIKLTETLEPEIATKTVKYTSSNPSIATVGEVNGRVTGVAPGTATITVTAVYGNKSATSTITVTCPEGKINNNGKCVCSAGQYYDTEKGCTACPIGTYTNAPNVSTQCTSCTGNNTYQDLSGQTSCKTCEGIVNSNHTSCTIERCYCSSDRSSCIWSSSQTSTYNREVAATSEDDCKKKIVCYEGYKKSSDGKSCEKCGTAKYCENGTEYNCPEGYYCENGRKTICPKNSYCPSGSSKAISCSTGKSNEVGEWITDGTGKTSSNSCVLSCPAGRYNAGNSSCNLCESGYYCEGGTQGYEQCPSYYTSDSGAKSKMSCYIDVQAGYGIEVAMGDKSQCSGNTYYPNTRRIYYGNTSKCISCSGMVDNNNLTCSTHVYVVGVIVDIKNVTLNKGESVTITEEVLPSDATDKSVSWTSSDPKVATVNNGVITAVGGGIATITVKTNDRNKTATVNVRVNCAKGAYFDDEQGVCKECNDRYYCPDGKNKIQCPKGYGFADPGATSESQCYTKVSPGTFIPYPKSSETDSLCPAGTFNNDAVRNVYYGNSTTCKQCEGNTYSTILGASDSGTCKPCPDGTISSNGATKCVSTTVNVTGISVSPRITILEVGDHTEPVVTIMPSNATNTNVTWSSSNSNIVTVNNGVITAVSGGTATVTARTEDGGKTATVSVRVNCEKGYYFDNTKCTKCGADGHYCPDGVNQMTCPTGYGQSNIGATSIEECYVEVPGGKFIPYPAARLTDCPAGTYNNKNQKVYYGNSSSCTKCPANTYSSYVGASSSSTCVNCTKGLVSPAGSVSSDKCVSTTVSVMGISVNPNSVILNKGDNATITETISPSNATNTNVTWSSSNANIAIVDNGVITAVGGGTAAVTVRTEDGGKTATVSVRVNCEKGYYFDNTKCTKCGADGHYCPDGVNQMTCPTGYGQSNIGATSIEECYVEVPGGKFIPYPAARLTDCPAGTYNNKNQKVYYGNSSSCTKCPANTYSSYVGASSSSTCVNCTKGLVSPAGSVSSDKCVSAIVNVTGISVNPNSVILNKGDNATITETISPSNATNKNVSWTSSRPSVATVTNSGIITAVGGGTATVSAVTEDGGKNASVSVTVACDKGSYLKDGSCTPCGVNGVYCPDGINQKKCPQYYNYSDSKSVDITHCYLYTIDGNDGLYVPYPTGAPQVCPAGTYITKQKVYYGTSNSCTKCPANTYSSIIGATSVNTCKTCPDGKVSPAGSTSSDKCIIETSVIKVTGINLIPKNSTINVGQTVAMEAKISPENATNKNIKWSSSNLDVATVNENTGFVTSHKEGVATITATSQDGSNISATATITVQKSNLSITCPEIAFVNTNFNCSISSGTIMGAVTSSDNSVAKVLTTGTSTFTSSAIKTGKVSFSALINGQTVESNIVTINEISLSKITGNNVIAIAADVGSVTGSYGAFNSNNASVEVNWSARGSDVTYTPYTLATSFRATFKHQGSPSASSCPIVTSGTVKATQGNNNKTLSVKVYSYCEWKEIEESNKGPFDSQIGATRDSMKYVVGCDAYEGWYQESGKWYYVNHYNRCCGSTQVVIPEEEYCYIKRGKDTPNAYCYGTTTDCNGYTEKISNINNKESCDEVAACYKNSQGKYVFGKYSGQSGYTYYGKTCPSSTVTYACYANAEKIEDATIVSWATGSSNAYPYLIKGVSEKNCQASACYANSDKTRYVWSTTKPSGYVRVEEINSRSLCKPENEACYLDSNGNYTWGRYAKIDGYTIITSIKNKSECKKPDLTYACYVKDDDYVWSTSKPSGYTLLSKITNPKECVKPEEAACYLHNNEYIWGKYASISGYSLVESIKERAYCVKPEEACYLSPNLKYVWGDYSSDKKYQLIDNITNRDDCITTYVTPQSGANISKIILIGISVFGVFGMIFIYQGYNKKKK